MNQYFLGNTLINDSYLGSIRVADIVTQPYLEVDYLVIAGGGGAGASATFGRTGGGGGAGGLLTGSLILMNSNTSYQTIIGLQGTGSLEGNISGQNGGNSSLIGGVLNVVTTGGGGGGGYTLNGKNGGSGGAGGGNFGAAGFGISTPIKQGNDGANGGSLSGGGGGGAAAAGGGSVGGSGSIWLDGIEYGRGGEQGNGGGAVTSGGGGVTFLQEGKGGNVGRVILRYPGTGSKATGGTITFSNGYTYHTFTSGTGSFTY